MNKIVSLGISSANIVKSMRNGGNVLVTTDTAGRVLELAQLLVSHFISFIELYYSNLLLALSCWQ